jgi:hypothetical protein
LNSLIYLAGGRMVSASFETRAGLLDMPYVRTFTNAPGFYRIWQKRDAAGIVTLLAERRVGRKQIGEGIGFLDVAVDGIPLWDLAKEPAPPWLIDTKPSGMP